MTSKELEARLVDFGVGIIELTESVKGTIAGKHLAGQLIRSGTSPALNYGEAMGSESLRDFHHKVKVVLKELRESFVNLRMMAKANLHQDHEKIASLAKENNELISIFVATAKTTQAKLAKISNDNPKPTADSD